MTGPRTSERPKLSGRVVENIGTVMAVGGAAVAAVALGALVIAHGGGATQPWPIDRTEYITGFASLLEMGAGLFVREQGKSMRRSR